MPENRLVLPIRRLFFVLLPLSGKAMYHVLGKHVVSTGNSCIYDQEHRSYCDIHAELEVHDEIKLLAPETTN